MIDFANLPEERTLNCNQCGQEFRTFTPRGLCTECQYYRDNPDQAPKYWTWTRHGDSDWAAVATWPGKDPLPEVGGAITVHRRDGSSSQKTITEVGELQYDTRGRARLRCWVQ